MPHVSRQRLDKKTASQIEDAFETCLSKLNKSDIKTVLFSLLTDTERLMLAKRLATVILLDRGMKDTDIADVLKVTRMTINKFDKGKNKPGFLLALKKLQKDKTNKEMIALLKSLGMDVAKYSAKAIGGRV